MSIQKVEDENAQNEKIKKCKKDARKGSQHKLVFEFDTGASIPSEMDSSHTQVQGPPLSAAENAGTVADQRPLFHVGTGIQIEVTDNTPQAHDESDLGPGLYQANQDGVRQRTG